MTIESNILFRVGSKAVGGFTELKSAIGLISGLMSKVKEATVELDRFSTMWRATNQSAVMAADAAAGGLVDTTEVMRGYQKLMAAGVKITEEQYATITARAADLAQTTGVDATDAFNRLTNSIAKGSTRALKQYGIDVKEGGDLTEMQNDAIRKLTEGYEGFNVEAKTTTEQLYVLNNNVDTLAGLFWESTGASEAFAGAIGKLNSGLSTFAGYMAEAPESTKAFITSVDGIVGYMTEVAEVVAEPFIQIERLINWVQGVDSKGTFEQALDKYLQIARESRQQALDKFYVARGEEAEERERQGIGQGQEPGAPGAPGGRRGRGRGKSKSYSGATTLSGGAESMTGFSAEDFSGLPGAFNMNTYMGAPVGEADPFGTAVTDLQETVFDPQNKERQEELREKELKTREALLELAREEQKQREEAREIEMQQVEELGATWGRTFDKVSAGAAKQNKWLGVLAKATGSAIENATKKEQTAGKAVANVLSDVGGAISTEATWQAVFEAAAAVASLAGQDYAGAALHTAAAAMYGIAAATAGGGGGGAGAAAAQSKAHVASTDRFTGGANATDWGGRGNNDGGEMTINIQMKEGAGGWFDAIVEENDRAGIDGRRAFTVGS